MGMGYIEKLMKMVVVIKKKNQESHSKINIKLIGLIK
jgi:hypothetical protein